MSEINSDWEEIVCKEGKTLYLENKKTGERRWPVSYMSYNDTSGHETMIKKDVLVIKKELSSVATQTDDAGCVHGCTSMYVSPLETFNMTFCTANTSLSRTTRDDSDNEQELLTDSGDESFVSCMNPDAIIEGGDATRNVHASDCEDEEEDEVPNYEEWADDSDIEEEETDSALINLSSNNHDNLLSSKGCEAEASCLQADVEREMVPDAHADLDNSDEIISDTETSTDQSISNDNDHLLDLEVGSKSTLMDGKAVPCLNSCTVEKERGAKLSCIDCSLSLPKDTARSKNLVNPSPDGSVESDCNVDITTNSGHCRDLHELDTSDLQLDEVCLLGNKETNVSWSNNISYHESSSKPKNFITHPSGDVSVGKEILSRNNNSLVEVCSLGKECSSNSESFVTNQSLPVHPSNDEVFVEKETSASTTCSNGVLSNSECLSSGGISNDESIEDEIFYTTSNDCQKNSETKTTSTDVLSSSDEGDMSVEEETLSTSSINTCFSNSGELESRGNFESNEVSEATVEGEKSSKIITLSARIVLTPVQFQTHLRYRCKPIQASSENQCLNSNQPVKNEIKPHLCDHCPKAFSKRSSLSRHLMVHTKQKPFHCQHCGNGYSDKGNLTSHLKVHSQEKPYKCKHCKWSFCRASDLTRHERIHSGEKPYKCEQCGKAFTQMGVLRQHEQVHSGQKPYKCQICRKKFTLKSNLIVHQRIHTGEKPFQCRRCEKSFTQKGALKEHQQLIHARKKAFKCSSCQEAFCTKRKLICHQPCHTKN